MKNWKHFPHDDEEEEEGGYYERFTRRDHLSMKEIAVMCAAAVVAWLVVAEVFW